MAGFVRSFGDERRPLSAAFSSDTGERIRSLPVEVLVIAGPGVDLGVANPAFEAAGALMLVFLPCRGVIHSAARAGEYFGRPDAVGHFDIRLTAVPFLSLFVQVYPRDLSKT